MPMQSMITCLEARHNDTHTYTHSHSTCSGASATASVADREISGEGNRAKVGDSGDCEGMTAGLHTAKVRGVSGGSGTCVCDPRTWTAVWCWGATGAAGKHFEQVPHQEPGKEE